MNLPTRQKQTPDIKNRRVAAKAGLGGGWRGSLGWQMQTLTFRMDKQQGTGFSGLSGNEHLLYPPRGLSGKESAAMRETGV